MLPLVARDVAVTSHVNQCYSSVHIIISGEKHKKIFPHLFHCAIHRTGACNLDDFGHLNMKFVHQNTYRHFIQIFAKIFKKIGVYFSLLPFVPSSLHV